MVHKEHICVSHHRNQSDIWFYHYSVGHRCSDTDMGSLTCYHWMWPQTHWLLSAIKQTMQNRYRIYVNAPCNIWNPVANIAGLSLSFGTMYCLLFFIIVQESRLIFQWNELSQQTKETIKCQLEPCYISKQFIAPNVELSLNDTIYSVAHAYLVSHWAKPTWFI